MRTDAPSSVESYIESHYASEDAGLAGVRARLVAAERWGVNIGPVEGRLLQVLLRSVGARRVVEIGTLYGYSAVWMARALATGGELLTLERDADCVREARTTFEACGVANVVRVVEGDALESLNGIAGPVDAVFIDANKSAYPEYLDWAERAVRSGGLLIADNVFLGGKIFGEKTNKQILAMRSFNERLATSGVFDATIFPTREGLTVAVKR